MRESVSNCVCNSELTHPVAAKSTFCAGVKGTPAETPAGASGDWEEVISSAWRGEHHRVRSCPVWARDDRQELSGGDRPGPRMASDEETLIETV